MYRFPTILTAVLTQVERAAIRQVLDEGPADGCFVEVDTGFANADHTSHCRDLAAAAQIYLAEGSPLAGDPALGERLRRAIAFFARWQRPSGCIDLPKVDIDSPPDTAFAVQLLATQLAYARSRAAAGFVPARWVAEALAPVIAQAARGIIGRGFRTPNHRWVVVSALAQAQALLPELSARALPYLDAVLAEGIDINADGEFSERSTGIYTAVCCRALRYAAAALQRPELLAPVRANLHFTACLLENDATIITAISGRQDRGGRQVPLTMADSLFDLAQRDQDGEWAYLADRLVERGLTTNQDNVGVGWLLQPYLDHPEYRRESLQRRRPAESGAWHFADSRLWFVRAPQLSAFAAAGPAIPFALRCGDVELRSFRCASTFFNDGRLVADHLEEIPNGVRLVRDPRPAEWDLPLGRPVRFREPAQYYEIARTERAHHPLPPFGFTLDIVRVGEAFHLHLTTQAGYDRIPVQVELSFNGPGFWHAPDLVVEAQAGSSIHLRRGSGLFRRGANAIRVDGGGDAHRWWQIPQLAADSDGFRVVLNLATPVDTTIVLTPGRWSPARPDDVLPLSPETHLPVEASCVRS